MADLRTRWIEYRIKFRNHLKQKREGRDWKKTLGVGAPLFVGVTLGSGYLLWSLPGLQPFAMALKDGPTTTGWPIWLDSYLLYLFHGVFGLTHFRVVQWDPFLRWLERTGLVWHLDLIAYGSLLLGSVAGVLSGWLLGLGAVKMIHEEGRHLYDHPDDAFMGTKDEIAVSGAGICVHPKVPISRDRETRHIMVMGSIGAGKTQVIRNIVLSILERFKRSKADRLIVYDNKSDFTAGLPIPEKKVQVRKADGTMAEVSAPPEEQDYILLAPWDQRTYGWAVAKDILNQVDAVEICKRIIPSSDDPFWSNAARGVLEAVFVKLQTERGTDWSWKDIYAEIGDSSKLAQAVFEFNPTMATLFKDPANKTAQSVLTTLATFSLTIKLLTQAWDNINPLTGQTYEEGRVIPTISLREWALTPEVRQRVIILQGNKRYATLEKAFIQSVISAFGAIMNSPEMTDDPNRRIWFILDEFPQLGKLEDFAPYLEVGRSKGLCVILGLQDMAQLREIYKRETADVWAAICGTFIICRSQGVETIEWIKKFVGDRTIRRWTKSTSKGGTSRSEQITKEGLVAEKDILGLGPKKTGVEALLSLNNEHGVYRLLWPYKGFPAQRPAQVQAEWTRFVANIQVSDETEKLRKALEDMEKGWGQPVGGSGPEETETSDWDNPYENDSPLPLPGEETRDAWRPLDTPTPGRQPLKIPAVEPLDEDDEEDEE